MHTCKECCAGHYPISAAPPWPCTFVYVGAIILRQCRDGFASSTRQRPYPIRVADANACFSMGRAMGLGLGPGNLCLAQRPHCRPPRARWCVCASGTCARAQMQCVCALARVWALACAFVRAFVRAYVHACTMCTFFAAGHCHSCPSHHAAVHTARATLLCNDAAQRCGTTLHRVHMRLHATAR